MDNKKVVSIEDRIPKLKEQRKKRANRMLIMLLSIFFLLILLIIYIQSPLSHVQTISVKGNMTFSDSEIIRKSGVTKKLNIWDISEDQVSINLKKLPEIKDVKVQSHWSGKVTILIKENKTIAYFSKETSFYPILENGEMLKNKHTVEIPVNAPILYNFQKGKILEKMVKELEHLPDEIVNSISEIHHIPKKTDEYHITLYMNDGYEVSATLRTFLEKMIHYPAIISQLDNNSKGVIDLEVGSFFEAYEQEGVEQSEQSGEEAEG